MRAAQYADNFYNGHPILPVTREDDGLYYSLDGRIMLIYIRARKSRDRHWEAVDTATKKVLRTAPSLVRLRLALA